MKILPFLPPSSVQGRVGGQKYLWRLEDLFDHIKGDRQLAPKPLASLSLDRAGNIQFLNSQFCEIFGEEFSVISDLLDDADAFDGQFQKLKTLEGTKNFLMSVREMDRGDIEIFFVPISEETARNVTKSTGVGVDSLPVPLMMIDPKGRLSDANARATKLIDRKMAPGTFVSDVFEGLGRSVSDWLSDAQQGRAVGRPEVLKVKHPQKEIFLQVSLAKMEDAGPDGDGSLLAVMNDATELKTLEAQFVQSQKMQAIGQLAGGVAHDFNNLLTAISGHCDLLLLRHDQGDPEYADLVQIHQNANRAASLVGQLLAFSRKQNLQPEVLDLRDTLSDLTHLLNRLVGEKVSLRLSHDPKLASIRADKRQLEQVLMNLVVNARDAMPQGGEIHISTSTAKVEEKIVRHRATVPAGEYMVVQVADQGVGIAADKLPKIFEPFYTTKRLGEGTGLGLSTAYGIVKQTGGFIFADSEVDKGTNFSLFFPVHQPAELADVTHDSPEKAQSTRPGEGVILLVEDEAPVRAFASRALRMRGYKVLEAENAEQALETLEDETLEVDVFVTDVIMPGLDGPTWGAPG